jgi:hypothetical protein
MQSGPSSQKSQASNQILVVGGTPIPVSPTPVPQKVEPIYRRHVGGFRAPAPPSETLVSIRIDSDGSVVKVFQDNSEKVAYKFEAALAASLKAKVDLISDADKYELKPDGNTAIMCDLYYKNEIYFKGAWVAVEEQKNCGTHDVLRPKEGALFPYEPNAVSINYAAVVLDTLLTGILQVQGFLGQ